jgi:hypothetical protein
MLRSWLQGTAPPAFAQEQYILTFEQQPSKQQKDEQRGSRYVPSAYYLPAFLRVCNESYFVSSACGTCAKRVYLLYRQTGTTVCRYVYKFPEMPNVQHTCSPSLACVLDPECTC